MFVRLLVCVLLAGATTLSQAAELKPATIGAWEAYVSLKEAEIEQCSCISIAAPPEAARLQQGAIIIHPAVNDGSFSVPSGLIHDWIGKVFIPHASLGEVLARIRSYDEYPEFYNPSVVEAKVIGSCGDSDRYALTMRQDVLAVRTGLAGEYVSEYHSIDPAHAFSFTSGVRLQEITRFGSRNQQMLDPDVGSGLIWRIYSEARYEEANGGVYLEVEAAALSRTVPRALAWAVNPMVERVARSALATSLRQTREAVLQENGNQLTSSRPPEGSEGRRQCLPDSSRSGEMFVPSLGAARPKSRLASAR